MNYNEDNGYFSDDGLFDAIHDKDTHLIIGGNLKSISEIEVDKEKAPIKLEPEYEDYILKIFADMREYCNEKGLDLLESPASLESFKEMMLFYKM